jgi:hypothetical protein
MAAAESSCLGPKLAPAVLFLTIEPAVVCRKRLVLAIVNLFPMYTTYGLTLGFFTLVYLEEKAMH